MPEILQTELKDALELTVFQTIMAPTIKTIIMMMVKIWCGMLGEP